MDRLALWDLLGLLAPLDLLALSGRVVRLGQLDLLAPLDPSSRLVRLRPLDLADLPPLNWCLLVRWVQQVPQGR